MPDHAPTPTAADYAVPLAEHLADLDALGPFATRHTAASHEAALRRALAAEAEGARLRGVVAALVAACQYAAGSFAQVSETRTVPPIVLHDCKRKLDEAARAALEGKEAGHDR